MNVGVISTRQLSFLVGVVPPRQNQLKDMSNLRDHTSQTGNALPLQTLRNTTGMTPIEQQFQRLAKHGQKALMPFVTAGDPDLHVTEQAIRAIAEEGCSFCEIGFPYSDPIADGPVIQASYTRALDQGISVNDITTMLSRVSQDVSLPLVGMVSYAIIFRRGVDAFLREASQAGLSGLIVPDLLVDDAEEIGPRFAAHGVNLIQLITPTTSRQRALRIAEASSGFLYYVSVTGITGERTALPERLIDEVSWLREQVSLPVCIGFGISQPEHVKQLAPHCDGLIVGSAIVRRLQQANPQQPQAAIDDMRRFLRELLGALE